MQIPGAIWLEIKWFLHEAVLSVKHHNDSDAERKAGELKRHVIIWGHEKRPEGQPSKNCSIRSEGILCWQFIDEGCSLFAYFEHVVC